jgi:phosphoglucomutase
MSPRIHPLAGQPAPPSFLVDIPRLVTAYYSERPDPANRAQRVTFGTSGHRGISFEGTFNDAHVAAISQAICVHRRSQGINGPLFMGFDTHALSAPAFATALEVLAANGVEVMIAAGDEYTPTPAVSHAILTYNHGRTSGLADGIVITPSHNPPDSGGFKYNPPNGGPAGADITGWIETHANELLHADLIGVQRIPLASARRAATTHLHDFIGAYVADLGTVIDMDAIRASTLRLGVDPLGGAGVHYWPRIAEHYGLKLDVVSVEVDASFRFMTLDWDGKIRMDPSSSYAMQRLIGMQDRFDVAFGCDTDHDRHGIVTATTGLLPANHYLSVMIDYLFRNRPEWQPGAGVGKTIVSSSMIDRVSARLKRTLREVPVGFKWFVDGLLDGSVGFGGEESAGAAFSRRDGRVWTTDKDGLIPGLLAAEMTAHSGRDPGEQYRALTDALGEMFADRVDAPATAAQKRKLSKLAPAEVKITELAGDRITAVLDKAPSVGAAFGGIKVMSDGGWFAARPSGTEDIYKIYGESYRSRDHLQKILSDAQTIVDAAIAGA